MSNSLIFLLLGGGTSDPTSTLPGSPQSASAHLAIEAPATHAKLRLRMQLDPFILEEPLILLEDGFPRLG